MLHLHWSSWEMEMHYPSILHLKMKQNRERFFLRKTLRMEHMISELWKMEILDLRESCMNTSLITRFRQVRK